MEKKKRRTKAAERVLFKYPEGASEMRKEFVDLVNEIITTTGEFLTDIHEKLNDDAQVMAAMPYSYDMLFGFVNTATRNADNGEIKLDVVMQHVKRLYAKELGLEEKTFSAQIAEVRIISQAIVDVLKELKNELDKVKAELFDLRISVDSIPNRVLVGTESIEKGISKIEASLKIKK